MLRAIFHAWERHLADVTKDRVVRPFDWGTDWIPLRRGIDHAGANSDQTRDDDASRNMQAWVSHVMADTDAFYTPEPTSRYTLADQGDGQLLTFPSASDAALRKQHRILPVLSNDRGAGIACAQAGGGCGAAAVER